MDNLRISHHDSIWDTSSDSSSDTVTRMESTPPVTPDLALGNPALRSHPNVLSREAIEATDREKIGHHMDHSGLFQEPFDTRRPTNCNTAEHFPPELRNTNVDSPTSRESAPPARAPAAPYLQLAYQALARNVSSQAAMEAADREKIGHHMDRTGVQETFDTERRTNWNTAEYFPQDLRNTNVDMSISRAPPARASAAPYLPLGHLAPPAPNVLRQIPIEGTDRENTGHYIDGTDLFHEFDTKRRTSLNTAEYIARDLRNTNLDSSTRRESATRTRAPAAPYLPFGYQTSPAVNVLSQVAIVSTDKGKIDHYMDLPRLFPEPFDTEGRRKRNSAECFPRDMRNTNVDSSTRRESAPPAAPDLPLGYEASHAPNALRQVAMEATDMEKIAHLMDCTHLFQEPFDERRTNVNTAKYVPPHLRNKNLNSLTCWESAPPARARAAPYLPLGYQQQPALNVLSHVAAEDIDTEKIWFFMGTTGLVPQGPYAMQTLRKFSNAGYLPLKLRIWKGTHCQEGPVYLKDALAERSPKKTEPSGKAQVVKTYAQVVRINPIEASIPVAQPLPTRSNLTFDDNSAAKDRGKNVEAVSSTGSRSGSEGRSGSLDVTNVTRQHSSHVPTRRSEVGESSDIGPAEFESRSNDAPCRYHNQFDCKNRGSYNFRRG